VSWIMVFPSSVRERNCSGLSFRLLGQKRSPRPPAINKAVVFIEASALSIRSNAGEKDVTSPPDRKCPQPRRQEVGIPPADRQRALTAHQFPRPADAQQMLEGFPIAAQRYGIPHLHTVCA